jgi:hypothetical protein
MAFLTLFLVVPCAQVMVAMCARMGLGEWFAVGSATLCNVFSGDAGRCQGANPYLAARHPRASLLDNDVLSNLIVTLEHRV